MDTRLHLVPKPASMADSVFDELQTRILSLDLPPAAKLSEADVAQQFGISRQPVRDAFYRLSLLGFLDIRPQRVTRVTRISATAILVARFLRTSAEVEMVRRACSVITEDDIAGLQCEIDAQAKAIENGDLGGFKRHDDAFHYGICAACGLGPVWASIAESKAHTDRVRTLSIKVGSQEALDDHQAILDAIAAREPDRAGHMVRRHLDRILGVMEELRRSDPDWFAPEKSS